MTYDPAFYHLVESAPREIDRFYRIAPNGSASCYRAIMGHRKTTPNTLIPLTKLDITKQDLSDLPPVHRHFLVNSCIALNDINMFTRLIILYGDAKSKHELVNFAALQTYMQLTRSLSGRIVEFIKLVDDYSKKCSRAKIDPDIVSSCGEFVKEARESPSFGRWKRFRDQITHHYILDDSDIQNNINQFDDDHLFSVVIHQASGNTLFTLAEDIGFRGAFGDFETSEEADQALNELMDWCISVGGLSQRFQAERVVELLDRYFPKLKKTPLRASVEERFIIRPSSRNPGIFFLQEKAPRKI